MWETLAKPQGSIIILHNRCNYTVNSCYYIITCHNLPAKPQGEEPDPSSPFLTTKAPELSYLPHPFCLGSLKASLCSPKLLCTVVSETTASPFRDISAAAGRQALGNKV